MPGRRALGVTFAGLLLSGSLWADIGLGGKVFDSRWAGIEKAFEAAKQTRDFSQVKEELRTFFTSESQDVKALGLRWIGYHQAELTTDELDNFSELFVALNPRNSLSEGVRVEMANRHLAEAPAEERSAIYMTAVRAGSVNLEGVEEMPRFVALGKAAVEGLEEFRPFIEQYREEIDAAYPADPYRRSQMFLWMLKLRAGAKDRPDAVRLHAARLAEMDDERFARLMDTDPAFRGATLSVLQTACEKRLSGPCLDIGRVAVRQDKVRERQVKAGLRKGASPDAADDWLESFRGLTGAARVKVEKERIESSTRPRQ